MRHCNPLNCGVVGVVACLLLAISLYGAPVPQAPAAGSITEIRMHRLYLGLLSGNEVIFRADDTATYQRDKGYPEPRRVSLQTGRLEKGTFERLRRLLEEGELSEWADKYAVKEHHRTKYVLTVKRGGSERVISDYGQAGPPSLWGFELILERLIDTTDWK